LITALITGIIGQFAIKRSPNNIEGGLEILNVGNAITLIQGEGHRLIGVDDYFVIADIWRHTGTNHSSIEDDIVLVQDDFGR
jgi:mannose-6-phosphate isomerase